MACHPRSAPRELSGEPVGAAATNAGMNIGTHVVAIGSAVLYRLTVPCVLGPLSPFPNLASATRSAVTPILVSALIPVVKAPSSLSQSPVSSGVYLSLRFWSKIARGMLTICSLQGLTQDRQLNLKRNIEIFDILHVYSENDFGPVVNFEIN